MNKYLILLSLLPALGLTDTIYMDSQANTCATYSPQTRGCSGGSAQNYSALNTALNNTNAGDTLLLRQGSLGQITPPKSGTVNNPITIKGYQNETVTISSSSVGLNVINRSNIIFENLVVTNVQGFGRIENSNRIQFNNISFSNAEASGTTGSLKFVRATFNSVTNSNFEEGSDLLIFQDDANQNVVEGNTFGTAAHSQISIRCSSMNVFRNNEMNNPDQKAVELYDCEGVSDAPVRMDDAKRNLFEYNRFYGTRSSGASNNYNAMQHGAQQTIVRYNTYTNNKGGGINYQYYSQESQYVYENRMYNNTFYANNCYAIIGQSGSTLYDNRVVNNLLYANKNCSGGGSSQVSISNSSKVILTNNTQASSNPGFVNAGAKDFRLVASSAEIDKGIPVARTTSAGTGSVLPVDDSGWFYDSYDIPNEVGDVIRVGTDKARIIAINGNNLTLDKVFTWANNQGVHLNYSGNAPDMGAFEFGDVPTETKPNPPRMN
jgi:hypothetical protein